MLQLPVSGAGGAGGHPHRPQRQDNAPAGGNPGRGRDHGGDRYGNRSLPGLPAAALQGGHAGRKVRLNLRVVYSSGRSLWGVQPLEGVEKIVRLWVGTILFYTQLL